MSSCSRDYPIGPYGVYSFGISYVDGKGGVGTSINHPPPINLIIGLMVEILCHL